MVLTLFYSARSAFILSYENEDGTSAASFDGDDSSLRVLNFGGDSSKAISRWFTVRYRGIYEVDPHGRVVCSLVANATTSTSFDGIKMGSAAKGTAVLVSYS